MDPHEHEAELLEANDTVSPIQEPHAVLPDPSQLEIPATEPPVAPPPDTDQATEEQARVLGNEQQDAEEPLTEATNEAAQEEVAVVQAGKAEIAVFESEPQAEGEEPGALETEPQGEEETVEVSESELPAMAETAATSEQDPIFDEDEIEENENTQKLPALSIQLLESEVAPEEAVVEEEVVVVDDVIEEKKQAEVVQAEEEEPADEDLEPEEQPTAKLIADEDVESGKAEPQPEVASQAEEDVADDEYGITEKILLPLVLMPEQVVSREQLDLAIAATDLPQTPLPPSETLPELPVVLSEQVGWNGTGVNGTSIRRTLVLPLPTPFKQKQDPDTLRVYRHRKLLLRHLSRRRIRKTREASHRSIHRTWMSVMVTLMSLLVVLISVTSTGSYAAYRFYTDTQEQLGVKVLSLRDLLPKDNLKMYDSKGVMIGQLTDNGIHTTVKYKDIDPDLVNATVSIEDKDFWSNQGLDINRILQSAIDDLRNNRVVAGGSTITQQLIKMLVVGDDPDIRERVMRKLKELALIPVINERYSKQDIVEMYLNTIYYGEQAYGIDSAASIYFGLEDKPDKPASKQLNLAQAAMLAGIPNSPYAFDPLLHPQAALGRMQIVLDSMVSNGYISRVQALEAYKEAQKPDFYKTPPTLKNRAPHFFYYVLRQLKERFHLTDKQLSRSDMSVTTTLDLGLQDKIQVIMKNHINELRDAHNASNAAEVLIDFHNGAIRSLLGSIDYESTTIDGKFDVATLAYRQPGSSFKPYVYAAAFEQGASPAQAILDAPLTIQLPPGSDKPTFTPLNYDRLYHGHMTLRCALQNSLNIPAVKVLQHVGIDKAMETARRIGIEHYEGYAGYSLVLGGIGVNLLEHTAAYGTFANNGVRVPPYAIEKVVFMNTNQSYQHENDPGTQAISPQVAYMITNTLSDNAARIPEFYDCNVLQLYSNSQSSCYYGNRGVVRPAAAKTGTTDSFKDNWTLGYTTDFVMGVWAGNNDNSEMINVTGVVGAAPVWHEAMLVAEEGLPIRDFQNPGGLLRSTVTYPDGVKTTDWFLPGTVPTFNNPVPSPVATTPSDPRDPKDPPRQPPIQPTSSPFCPSSFSYGFAPPASKNSPGWW
jgi:membrane peptidoglycan carboxypeptidase